MSSVRTNKLLTVKTGEALSTHANDPLTPTHPVTFATHSAVAFYQALKVFAVWQCAALSRCRCRSKDIVYNR